MRETPFYAYAYSKGGKRRVYTPKIQRYPLINVNNADSYKTDVYRGIFITADGLGGYNGAMEASKYAVNIELYPKMKKLHTLIMQKNIDETLILKKLESHIMNANDGVKSLGMTEHLKDCGTTIDAIILSDNVLFGAHVGDGSVFRIDTKNSRIKLLTEIDKDINYDPGLSRLQNDILNFDKVAYCLGREYTPVQTYSEPISDSDIILMATDGLTKKVHPAEMLSSFSDKNFIEGVKMLKQYCRTPVKMLGEATEVSMKRKMIDKDILFNDDTTFIAIRRR
ncbi:MAG: PP2C family protein-serine/threonine phosphatase [Candidatus Woesearchaeota archaeon]